jgi:hypothetical protein
MAQQQVPTFKLVLVGDGGTGKVRYISFGSVPIAPSFLRRAMLALSLAIYK